LDLSEWTQYIDNEIVDFKMFNTEMYKSKIFTV